MPCDSSDHVIFEAGELFHSYSLEIESSQGIVTSTVRREEDAAIRPKRLVNDNEGPQMWGDLGRVRYTQASLTILQAFMCAGFLTGWGAMTLILKGEGTYRYLCDTAGPKLKAQETLPLYSKIGAMVHGLPVEAWGGHGGRRLNLHEGGCVEEDLQINLIFVVGCSLQFALAFPLGLLLDSFGPRFGGLLQCGTAFGCFLCGVARPGPGQTDLFFLGMTLLNACGFAVWTGSFHVANLFPNHTGLMCAAISTACGLSSLICPVFELVWRAGGATRASLFVAYAIFVAFFALFAMLQPNNKFQIGDRCCFSLDIGVVWRRLCDLFLCRRRNGEKRSDEGLGFYSVPSIASTTSPVSQGITLDARVIYEVEGQMVVTSGHLTKAGVWKERLKAKWKSLSRDIFSKHYGFLILYLGLWAYICIFYLSTANLQIAQIVSAETTRGTTLATDNELVTWWTTVFSWICPTGVMAALVIGFVVGRFGFVAAWLVQFAVGLVFLAFSLIPVIEVQPVTFFTFTFAREMAYAVGLAFVGAHFGYENDVALSGLLFTTIGLLSLTINGVVAAILASGSLFRYAMAAFLVVGVSSVCYPVWLHFGFKKNRWNNEDDCDYRMLPSHD